MPPQHTAIFHGCRNDSFDHESKTCDIFLIFALNIDRGYMLLRRFLRVLTIYVLENNLYPCKHQFYYTRQKEEERNAYVDIFPFSLPFGVQVVLSIKSMLLIGL